MKKGLLLSLYLALQTSLAFSAEQIETSLDKASPKVAIHLPEDRSQWLEVTKEFFTPILTSEEVKTELMKLLQYLMPTTGDFDPRIVQNRERGINTTYNRLCGKSAEEQIKEIKRMHAFHQKMLSK